MNRLVLSFMALVAAMAVSARDYYVSPSGSDTGTGSADKPLATLRKAVEPVPINKVAVLFAVSYLYEHQENADMDELTRMLRYILATEREVAF